MLGPTSPSSQLERSAKDRARASAAHYSQLNPEEKCIYRGEILRRIWFARLYAPDSVPELTKCRTCGAAEDAAHEERACVKRGGQCVPVRPVARWQQVPAWLRDPARQSVSTATYMGGRGSGKTMAINSYILPELLTRPNMRAAFLGPDFAVSVGVAIKGRSGIKTLVDAMDPDLIHQFNEAKNWVRFANGAWINCLSTKEPGSIEGEEYHLSWCDELAELKGQGGDNCVWRKRLEPGVRLVGERGEPVRHFMSGTPEATPLIKDLWDSTKLSPEEYEWIQLATRDNIANLDRGKVERQYREAGDSRYARMKLEGELILESKNALLNGAAIERVQVKPDTTGYERHREPEQLGKVILVVDANRSEDKKSDECGIHVMGRRDLHDDPRIAHVLADASTGGGPEVWGRRIIEVLRSYPEIDEVVVEDDKSLVIDVVERVLRDELQSIGRIITVVPIHHRNRSKKQRADPVSVEYHLVHVLHDPCSRTPQWADLSMLEWQWVSWNPKDTTAKSPDRLDAAVYGAEYLLLQDREPDTFHSPSSVAAPVRTTMRTVTRQDWGGQHFAGDPPRRSAGGRPPWR